MMPRRDYDPFAGRRVGLVMSHGWLAYGMNHGRLQWLSYRWKRAIVHAWNPVVCFFAGHDLELFSLPQRIPEPACTHCSWRPTQAPRRSA